MKKPLIITGSAGVGKSLIANTIAAHFDATIYDNHIVSVRSFTTLYEENFDIIVVDKDQGDILDAARDRGMEIIDLDKVKAPGKDCQPTDPLDQIKQIARWHNLRVTITVE